jgi:hypothetical protein
MAHGENNMKGIYSRTFTVQDNKLNEAIEICKGLAEVRKVHFPDAHSYFSFQIGGNPRSFRETMIGEMFDGDYEKDMAMSADPKYIELIEKLSQVMVHGTMQDEMRMIFTD